MRLMRRPSHDRDKLPGNCVATVGTFDGLHLGHQRILSRVLYGARAKFALRRTFLRADAA
jgi:FAD synthase